MYSLGALANLCCCREAVALFFELEGPRHLQEVVLPSRHQLAHPFALIVSAVTGEQFEGGLGRHKATLDAVNRVVDAGLLPPLLVFASLPATGAQGQQVPTLRPTRCVPAPSRATSAVRRGPQAHEKRAARRARLHGRRNANASCCAGARARLPVPPPPLLPPPPPPLLRTVVTVGGRL